MLVEFPSVIDAVRSAAEMQRTAIDHNEKTTADQRNLFRIGINLPDLFCPGS